MSHESSSVSRPAPVRARQIAAEAAPSTQSTAPVMPLASSEARKQTALLTSRLVTI